MFIPEINIMLYAKYVSIIKGNLGREKCCTEALGSLLRTFGGGRAERMGGEDEADKPGRAEFS